MGSEGRFWRLVGCWDQQLDLHPTLDLPQFPLPCPGRKSLELGRRWQVPPLQPFDLLRACPGCKVVFVAEQSICVFQLRAPTSNHCVAPIQKCGAWMFSTIYPFLFPLYPDGPPGWIMIPFVLATVASGGNEKVIGFPYPVPSRNGLDQAERLARCFWHGK